MNNITQEKYIKKQKRKNVLIVITQISIFVLFILIWELLARFELINTFIFSSPSRILSTIINLYNENNLFIHISKTIYETLISFILTSVIGLLISIILYECQFLARVTDPYLTMLNSLPKVALGPIIIIWMGANDKSIIFMAMLISLIVCIQTLYSSFRNTDKIKIRLLETFKASKIQILFNVVIPANYKNIINTLKINISMCLIGIKDICRKTPVFFENKKGTKKEIKSSPKCTFYIFLQFFNINYLLIPHHI